MNILIVSATEYEVLPFIDKYSDVLVSESLHLFQFAINNHKVTVLITGVGMVNAAYMMGCISNTSFNMAIQVGICGSFSNQYPIGTVLNITKDVISEMGAEDGARFIKYNNLNLPGTHEYEFQFLDNNHFINRLPKVLGITVNKVHGNIESIEKIQNLYNPDVESMEGAAFFRGCENFKEFVQVRAVSNFVEQRDKSKWNIPLAVTNLNGFLNAFIMSLNAAD